jgi:hypothetical protein
MPRYQCRDAGAYCVLHDMFPVGSDSRCRGAPCGCPTKIGQARGLPLLLHHATILANTISLRQPQMPVPLAISRSFNQQKSPTLPAFLAFPLRRLLRFARNDKVRDVIARNEMTIQSPTSLPEIPKPISHPLTDFHRHCS